MKYFLLYLFLFLVGSMIGYLTEVLFRRYFSAHKWVNPGFMKGPWLPLYGFGLILMFSICLLFVNLLPDSWNVYNPNNFYGRATASGPSVYDLVPIVSMGLGMNLLEFVAGLIFVKGFKVRLWDYSNMKGNILGIVCPLFSAIWMIVAIVFYYAINPFVCDAAMKTYAYMFGETVGGDASHFGFIFFLGVVYGIMLIDFVTSIGLFNRISRLAHDSGVIAKYDKLVEEQKRGRREAKEKFLESLPQKVREAIEKKPLDNEKAKELAYRVRSAVMIDPDKQSTKDNYDEKGRPVSTENTDGQ